MVGSHLTIFEPTSNGSPYLCVPAMPGEAGYESPGETEFNMSMGSSLVTDSKSPRPSRPTTARTVSTRFIPQIPPGSGLPGTSQPNLSSIDMVVEKRPIPHKVRFKDRVKLYQWTWFTMTMATGGIANLLHSIAYRTDWLWGIGMAFYIFNLCLFVLNCVLIAWRFWMVKGSFVRSFSDQVESLFIPAFVS